MAKTLRVRTKEGWVTKPLAQLLQNALTSGEIDDNFLELESQIELNYSELDGKIGSNYSELDGKIGSNYSELDGKINSNYSELIGVTSDIQTQLDDKAPLASPALTGTPTAPTAANGTNTTQIATTAFVVGQAGSDTPTANGTAAVGTSLRFARQDHVHPTDTSRAPLASPAFTGTPTAPTAATGTNTTQVATTAFVRSQISTDFVSSKSTNGYQKLPGGLIFQWGLLTTTAGSTATTFPITFPTACVNVNISGAIKSSAYYQENAISGVTTSGFTSYHDASGLNKYWFAIGY